MLAVALAALAVQLLAWAWIAAGLNHVRDAQPEPGAPTPPRPLSIVVAAHNEESRLPALLDALEQQTHPAFEVIVVDDRSTDGTAALVEQRARAWAAEGGRDLRLVTVSPDEPEAAGRPPKKHALTRGIEAARHDRLALTDADTTPPPTWLSFFGLESQEPGTDAPDDGAVLVGYGPLVGGQGIGGLFVRYETVLTAVLTAAAVGHGRAYMAVGRNLSYPRALPARLGGFAGGLSGDDDLLVQAAAAAGVPVRYVLDRAAFVPSAAPPGVRAWLRQKRRHASAGRRYPVAVLAALGLFHASALALWLAPLALGWTGGALLAARLLVQRGALRRVFSDFDALDLSFPHPFLDLLYALYNVLFSILGALPDPRRW